MEDHMFALSNQLKETLKVEKGSKNIVTDEPPVKNVKICIIDDSPTVQEEIVFAIKNVQSVKKVIKTSKMDYFEKYANEQIDIIITEVEFANKIEPSFIDKLKLISPETKIIVYTKTQNHAIRNRLLQNGADAFIFSRDISYLLEYIVKIMIRTKSYMFLFIPLPTIYNGFLNN